MTTISGFRSQLFRAANEVHELTPLQAQQLLEGAVALIRCMREQTGMEPNTEAPDVTNVLLDIAASVPNRSEREIRNALLESADIIRLLTMILDSLDELGAARDLEGPRTFNRRRSLVELSGIEPLTSCMPCKRSPS